MIEEARAVAQRLRKRMPQALVSADMDEAADTIDALVQEVERLKQYVPEVGFGNMEQAEPVAWRYQNANTDHVYLVWKKGTGGRNWTPLFESPCQTCVSLARSVMMDQRGEA